MSKISYSSCASFIKLNANELNCCCHRKSFQFLPLRRQTEFLDFFFFLFPNISIVLCRHCHWIYYFLLKLRSSSLPRIRIELDHVDKRAKQTEPNACPFHVISATDSEQTTDFVHNSCDISSTSFFPFAFSGECWTLAGAVLNFVWKLRGKKKERKKKKWLFINKRCCRRCIFNGFECRLKCYCLR